MDKYRVTNIIWLSGVSKVSFRGGGGGEVGFKLICEKCAYLHSALCHAERGIEATCMLGGSGVCSLEKFFFDAFWSVFCYNFVKKYCKNIHFHKNQKYCITAHYI